MAVLQTPPVSLGGEGCASVIVAIPCLNEETTIAKVIQDFRLALPGAEIWVFDNCSDDATADTAVKNGAKLHPVRQRGKGRVVREIFEVVDADVLVMVDGDDTYFAEDAPRLMAPVLSGEVDMVVGNRLESADEVSLRRLHQLGNRLIVWAINSMFGSDYRDILSGYRVFNRRFLDTVMPMTSGFEIETELTIGALENEMAVLEMPVSYRSRPPDSHSKLRSFRDGYRIVLTAAILLRDRYPLRVFGTFSAVCLCLTLVSAILRIIGWPGLPQSTTVGLVLLFAPLGLVSLGVGLILNTINTRTREVLHALRRRRRARG